ncbi:glycosyltransferase family 2 protein [Gimesia sp.]|uniref:glycosyltransferase family 2 protein n=1 Tax=Gimesia sp. TaxID=2024833 RepID=UPI003A8EDD28
MVNNELISTIIVNFNSGDKVSLCVQSLLDTKLNLEIIIVDNASSDQSLKALKEVTSSESNIHYIENQKNYGFAVACNQGARLARGEFLLYLNPDCKIHPDAIPKLIACLEQTPGVGMTGGYILNSDGSEQVGCRRSIPTPWRTLVRVFCLSFLSKYFPGLFSDFNLNNQELPDHPIEVEAISGACMLVSREAYEAVGGLDEEYFLHCEDLDWCMSFRNKGWKIMFVPDAEVTHFQGACSRSRPIFVEWYKHKGMMRFYRKFFRRQYPGVLMWLVGFAVWLRFGLLVCYFSVRHVLRYLKNLCQGKHVGTRQVQTAIVTTDGSS